MVYGINIGGRRGGGGDPAATLVAAPIAAPVSAPAVAVASWPLHDLVITNIVWCMA